MGEHPWAVNYTRVRGVGGSYVASFSELSRCPPLHPIDHRKDGLLVVALHDADENSVRRWAV